MDAMVRCLLRAFASGNGEVGAAFGRPFWFRTCCELLAGEVDRLGWSARGRRRQAPSGTRRAPVHGRDGDVLVASFCERQWGRWGGLWPPFLVLPGLRVCWLARWTGGQDSARGRRRQAPSGTRRKSVHGGSMATSMSPTVPEGARRRRPDNLTRAVGKAGAEQSRCRAKQSRSGSGEMGQVLPERHDGHRALHPAGCRNR